MNRGRKQRGFALLLVMILLAMGVILGVSYASSASMSRTCSTNQAQMVRARYLAESGLQHAMYLMRRHPDLLQSQTTLGPFSVDASGGTYTLIAAPTGVPGQFSVVSSASFGRSVQSCNMLAQCQVGQSGPSITQSLLVGGGISWVPSGGRITGPVHTNGHLFNFGRISGATTASGVVINAGVISPAPQGGVEAVEMPSFSPDDYEHYLYNGQIGRALVLTDNEIRVNESFNNGRAITAANPAGVVIVTPSSSAGVRIENNVKFQGTLIVRGDVLFDGKHVTMAAEEGFPALIVTGTMLMGSGKDLTVDGLTYIKQGIQASNDSGTDMTVNGALVCGATAFWPGLRGSYNVNFDAARTTLVSPTGAGGRDGAVLVQRWSE